jgi:hypothetical protein
MGSFRQQHADSAVDGPEACVQGLACRSMHPPVIVTNLSAHLDVVAAMEVDMCKFLFLNFLPSSSDKAINHMVRVLMNSRHQTGALDRTMGNQLGFEKGTCTI